MSLLQVNRILLRSRFMLGRLGKKISASGFILSVVRDGYKIPFLAFPPLKVSSNNTSALNDTYFVSEAISDFLKTKRVEILDRQPDIVNPLSTVSVQPSGKKKLMLDLRHVNFVGVKTLL